MSRTCPSLTTLTPPSISTAFPVNQPVSPPTKIRNRMFIKPPALNNYDPEKGVIPTPNRKDHLVNRASSDLAGGRVPTSTVSTLGALSSPSTGPSRPQDGTLT